MKKLLALAIVMAAAVSCSDDDLPVGPNLQPDDQFIVGFPSAAVAYSYFADEGQVQREFPLVLIGGNEGNPADEPIVISYEVVPFNPANGSGSTATQGTEFDFVNTTGQITIPAGQDFVQFPLLVNTGSLDETAATRLVLNLTQVSGPETIISQNNRTFTVNFVGCQADLAGSYTVSVLRESSGATTTLPNPEIISEISTNYFKTTNTGTFNPGQGADQGFFFNVLCDEITVPSQWLFAGEYVGYEVIGVPFDSGDYAGMEGVIIDENTFKIRYKAWGGSASGYIFWTNTYVRN